MTGLAPRDLARLAYAPDGTAYIPWVSMALPGRFLVNRVVDARTEHQVAQCTSPEAQAAALRLLSLGGSTW